MYEDKEIKERILAKAEEMFLQFGYQKVKMEEIASGLGISKKTLYKFFPSKENLIREMVLSRQCTVENHINKIWEDESLDFVAKLKVMMDYLGQQSSRIRGPLMDDIRKCIPDIWNEINDFKKIRGLEKAKGLFELGIKNGSFRSDIGQDLVILMFNFAIDGILNPEVLSQVPYTGAQAVETIFKVIFEGIFTEEGRAKYISINYGKDKTVNEIQNDE
ncbi:MAG: TetR/AcrR family transcriptional regulator [Ignavibacteriaceae bacterium]|nr:TetR/AcrR family transcriptional regulator [Ignavibacteriaceae bacterium]